MIHKNRGNRRKQNYSKAIRKEKLARELYGSKPLSEDGWHYFASLNAYSKNKIHCSCPMCSSKTNNKHNRCYGPSKNYTIKDQKIVDSMNYSMNEYLKGV